MDAEFVERLRQIADYLKGGSQLTPELVDYLEGVQDSLAGLFEKHEQATLEGAEVMNELFREGLKLIHDGIEEILLVHDGEGDIDALASALTSVEEGGDVLESVRYAIENDTSWTAGASLG